MIEYNQSQIATLNLEKINYAIKHKIILCLALNCGYQNRKFPIKAIRYNTITGMYIGKNTNGRWMAVALEKIFIEHI